MSNRYDFLPVAQDTPAERKLQAEALAMLVARKAAQRELDRREAAKDAMDTWARKAIAASKPAPVVGAQQAARDAMICRQDPTWKSEPTVDPQRVAVAMRMDAADPRSGQAKAREAMLRRLGGR